MTFHALLYTLLSSLIAFFPVINPIGDALIVQNSLHGLDETQRRAAARKIFFNCVFLGLGSLLLGRLVLLLFGLVVPVIQTAGGFIICKMGYDMLSTSDASTVQSGKTVEKVDFDAVKVRLFYPLSFPVCIGPGSISVIFTLMAAATVKDDVLATGVNYLMIALALIILITLLYVFLLQGPRFMKKLGRSGNLIIGKFIAFITFCVGLQIIVTGISKIFHLTIL